MNKFIFSSVVVYSHDIFLGRKAYEELCSRGMPDERSGSIVLSSGESIRWENLAGRTDAWLQPQD